MLATVAAYVVRGRQQTHKHSDIFQLPVTYYNITDLQSTNCSKVYDKHTDKVIYSLNTETTSNFNMQ